MALAGRSSGKGSGRDAGGPVSSEVWVSDNRATNHITSNVRNVYDWIDIPSGKERVMIANGKAMRVIGLGSLNLIMHSKTDLGVKRTGVYVTQGIRFNLFSLDDAQSRQPITHDKDGVHLCDHLLIFPLDDIGSCLYATRLNPIPSTGTTAVPSVSGVPTPPPPTAQESTLSSFSPPLLLESPTPPLA